MIEMRAILINEAELSTHSFVIIGYRPHDSVAQRMVLQYRVKPPVGPFNSIIPLGQQLYVPEWTEWQDVGALLIAESDEDKP